MKTIWINHDPQKVDVHLLRESCEQKGYHLIAQAVENKPEIVLEMAQKADVIISSMETWNEETLSALQGQHKLILRYGVGIDNIDLPTATKYGIPIANIPGANAVPVAEVALLHILNLGRCFYEELHSIQNGGWTAGTLGTELDGKVLGLVGFGNIARQLARMVSGFYVKILAYDPFINETVRQEAESKGVRFADTMEELFSTADIVSLHIPLTSETRGSINMHYFERMKPTAILINTCRGGVIHEPDLIEALKTGKFRAAGVDVLCHEPRLEGDPMYDVPNLYITPHIASNTYECGIRSQQCMVDTIEAFFHGELPANVLNKKDLQ